jgi:hypothetical protein
MSNTDKQITLEEMLEMFGGRIPMEALILLNEPGDRTLDQIRNELRTLSRPPEDTRDKLIERLRACQIEYCENLPVGYGPPYNPDGPEAADLLETDRQTIEGLREALQRIERHANCEFSVRNIARKALDDGGEK